MTTRYACSLNGQALHELDPSIYVLDIIESPPAMRTEVSTRPLGIGSRLLCMERLSLSVRVSFAIRAYQVQQRKAICSRIAAWALPGGMLTVNDRPGQRLRVRCTGLPVISSALGWTEALCVTFTAYELPYWEAEEPAEAALPASRSASASLDVPGNGPLAWLDAELVCSGTATVSIVTPVSSLTLSQLSGTCVISHDKGVLTITSGSEACLVKRTAGSSDDLLCLPGRENPLQITATAALSVTFRTRGCFL